MNAVLEIELKEEQMTYILPALIRLPHTPASDQPYRIER